MRGNLSLPQFVSADKHCAISVGAAWRWSSIFSKCFCKSCQFIFVAPCQYIPRCRRPENTRNSCGFAVWTNVKFHDGLPKRWENKCLDCYSSANLDFSLMSPTSWGQGVYKTWVWSADCGFRPNGHTICNLVPKAIKPPTLGQTLLLYLVSHRVRRSWYSTLTVIGIQNQCDMSSYSLSAKLWPFSPFVTLSATLSFRRSTKKQSNQKQKPHLTFRCQQSFGLIRNQAAWESGGKKKKVTASRENLVI